MVVYAYAGLMVASTLGLDVLAASTRGDVDAADCRIERLTSPPARSAEIWTHPSRTRNRSPNLFLARGEGGFLLGFPHLADFQISKEGDRIGAWPAPETSEETLHHLLLNQVLPRVLAHRGRLVLHAGAVCAENRAIAFVGPTGSGKSTLTASFHAAGHKLLSDDGLVLNSIVGGITVLPTYPSLRLWPGSVAGLFVEPPTLAPMAHYSTKRRVRLDEDETIGHPVPLAAVFVLAPTSKTGVLTISPTRLSPKDACMALIENSFQLDVTDTRRVAGVLSEAAKVAQQVPVIRLAYPRRFELLPSVRAAILERREFWVGPGASRYSG